MFAARYQEIGQLTSALVLRTLIDALDAGFRKKFPRDYIVNAMRQLGYKLPEGGGEHGEHGKIIEALNVFFENGDDVKEEMQKIMGEVKALYVHLVQYAEESDHATVLSPGRRKPFPVDLFSRCLH